jgi:hypothetical protein
MEPATIRRKGYLALRTKLTAPIKEQMIIPFASMTDDQKDLVRDVELKRMIQFGSYKNRDVNDLFSKSCSRFIGQTAKFSVEGEWFSSSPNRQDDENLDQPLSQSAYDGGDKRQKFMTLWHGRDWMKTLMTRSDAKDKDGLALLSFSKFGGLLQQGKIKGQLTDRRVHHLLHAPRPNPYLIHIRHTALLHSPG